MAPSVLAEYFYCSYVNCKGDEERFPVNEYSPNEIVVRTEWPKSATAPLPRDIEPRYHSYTGGLCGGCDTEYKIIPDYAEHDGEQFSGRSDGTRLLADKDAYNDLKWEVEDAIFDAFEDFTLAFTPENNKTDDELREAKRRAGVALRIADQKENIALRNSTEAEPTEDYYFKERQRSRHEVQDFKIKVESILAERMRHSQHAK